MYSRKFCATVNGKRRRVEVDMPRGYANDVEEAELMVMNTEYLYREFYRDATQADFDAPLENIKLVRL